MKKSFLTLAVVIFASSLFANNNTTNNSNEEDFGCVRIVTQTDSEGNTTTQEFPCTTISSTRPLGHQR